MQQEHRMWNGRNHPLVATLILLAVSTFETIMPLGIAMTKLSSLSHGSNGKITISYTELLLPRTTTDKVAVADVPAVHQREITSPSSSNDYFDWNDLNMTYRAANCGIFKCFFQSLSNQTIGYLVANADKHWQQMSKSWGLAAELQARYDAKHLYLEPPQRVPLFYIDSSFLGRLQQAVDQPLRRAAQSGVAAGDSFFPNPHHVYGDRQGDSNKKNKNETATWYAIQKVRRAPAGSLVYGCCKCTSKMKALEMAVPAFGRRLQSTLSFDQTLRADRQVVEQALSGRALLWFDFQGLIDPSGNFWFIDLDGPFDQEAQLLKIPRRRRMMYVQKRLDYLDKIHHLIMDAAKSNSIKGEKMKP